MKRLFILLIVVLAFSVPVFPAFPALAQPADPAAYFPSDLALYADIRTDDTGMAALDQLTNLDLQLSGSPNSSALDQVITPLLQTYLPGIDVRADILPWLGDHLGVGLPQGTSATQLTNAPLIFVLPIRDATAAQAFVTKVSAGITPASVGGVSVYKSKTFGLAVSTDVLWLSSADGIDAFLNHPMLQRLTDNPGFQKVRAALPTDAVLDAYASGAFLLSALSDFQQTLPPDQPSLSVFVQAALRLHPAQSPAKAALMAATALDGFGFTLQLSGDHVNLTSALSIDAQYPAPTLTNATAGTALLKLIPGNSFAVFDSYDLSLTVIPLALLTYFGPTTGSTFGSIVVSLDTGVIEPTPTPTPTPTPKPSMTVDAMIAQIQPILTQAQSTMGLSLDQLYSLINGEYALALFPKDSATYSAALYLQSSDPQKIIDTLDHASKLILTNPSSGAQLITVTHQTIDGIDVALISAPTGGEPLALGRLENNVLFLTAQSNLTQVIDAAKNQNQPVAALNWRDVFGTAQDALFYVDAHTYDLYTSSQQSNPPISIVAGSLDLRDNGLVVFNLTATLAS